LSLESLLDTFFQESNELFSLLDRDATVLRPNLRLKKILNLAEGERLNLWDLIIHEDREFAQSHWQRVLNDHAQESIDLRFKNLTGEFFLFKCSFYYQGHNILLHGVDITEVVQLKDSLRQSHQMAKLGRWEWNPMHDEFSWCPEASKVFEAPIPFVPTLNKIVSQFQDSHQDVLKRAIINARDKKERFDLKLKIKTFDNNLRWVRIIGENVKDIKSSTFVSGMIQNISEKKSYEDSLKTVLNILPTSLVIADLETGNVLYKNKLFNQFFNIPPTSKDISILSLFSRSDQYQEVSDSMKDLGKKIREVEMTTFSDEQKNIQVHYDSCIYMGRKCIAATFLDTTDLHWAHGKISELEGQYDSVFYNAGSAIISINAHGVIYSANHAAARIFGYQREELIGRKVNDLMPSPYNESHDSYLRNFNTEKKSEVIGVIREVEGVKKNGEIFPIEINVGSYQIDKEPYYVGVMNDISDRKEAERITQQTSRMAAIGELAAGVGHEIKNPLAIIQGNLHPIKKKILQGVDVSEEKLVKAIDRQEKAIERIANIVNGLRTVARQDQDDIAIFDFNELLNETLGLVEVILEKSNIKMKQNLTAENSHIKMNMGKLQQVLINLFNNAKDAFDELNRREENIISIMTTNNLGNLVIEIKDNGPGIPPVSLKKLFDSFYTTKERGKGTGLGLSLSKGFIEEVEGQISCISNLGEGACFIIELPIQSP
jgi:PAS domain S-box-containing protein